jgi:hypothetical protein
MPMASNPVIEIPGGTLMLIFNGGFGTLVWVEMRDLKDSAAAFSDLRTHRAASPKIFLTP